MTNPNHICSEIEYFHPGKEVYVHSDLCFDKDRMNDNYREFLHQNLDEFLNNYNPALGQGHFYGG